MATDIKTYRHAKSGVVREYSARFAAGFPDLVEVEPGTKPLAYTPIPESEVKEVLALTAPLKDIDQDASDKDEDD